MVTYWLTGEPCPECGELANTKYPGVYASDERIERFNSNLSDIKNKILADLKNEPSNGWPYPLYEGSWEIGLVKIQLSKRRLDKNKPYVCEYEYRCYLCSHSISGEDYDKMMEDKKPAEEKIIQEKLDRWLFDYPPIVIKLY